MRFVFISSKDFLHQLFRKDKCFCDDSWYEVQDYLLANTAEDIEEVRASMMRALASRSPEQPFT